MKTKCQGIISRWSGPTDPETGLLPSCDGGDVDFSSGLCAFRQENPKKVSLLPQARRLLVLQAKQESDCHRGTRSQRQRLWL